MKKITNKFKPRECIYRLGKRTYLTQPTNTVIKYYIKDEEFNSYIAVLRRQLYILPIIAILVIIFTVLFKLNHQSINIKVNAPSMMYLNNNMLSLDLDNESDYDIVYEVRISDESIATGIVKAKSSKSNVDCSFVSDKGVLSGVLYISYDGHIEKYSISLTVNNDL